MNLRDALGRVAELRAKILESQKFRGYSGRARAIGGCAALAGGLALRFVPEGGRHVAIPYVWGGVFVFAFLLNYGAVLRWWWNLSGEERARSPLTPALENLPVFVVGGILTAHLLAYGPFAALPGMWATVFGLTHFTAKYSLPRAMRRIGWWYIVCGAALLFRQDDALAEPALPALVFFAGEWAGGWIIFRAHHAGGPASFLFGTKPAPEPEIADID